MDVGLAIRVGTMLYGFCNGFFGRDSYSNKRVEAVGADWVVVREENGNPNFADFSQWNAQDVLEMIEKWKVNGNS